MKAGAARQGRRRWLDGFLESCARRNARAIQPLVAGPRILEVGAAEAWIGAALKAQDGKRDVQLLDVVDLNRTKLPLTLYDGETIPFPDRSFDTTLVMTVLHHCDAPERVLAEAARVTRGRLIVTESVYRVASGRWLLWALDNLVNALRSGGLMPRGLHFRTVDGWHDAFARHGLRLCDQRWLSRGLHRHVVFVLEPAAAAAQSCAPHPLPAMGETAKVAAE